MKTYEQLAEEAFEAYRMHCNSAMKTPTPIPQYKDLFRCEKEAWIYATRHIVEQANQVY